MTISKINFRSNGTSEPQNCFNRQGAATDGSLNDRLLATRLHFSEIIRRSLIPEKEPATPSSPIEPSRVVKQSADNKSSSAAEGKEIWRSVSAIDPRITYQREVDATDPSAKTLYSLRFSHKELIQNARKVGQFKDQAKHEDEYALNQAAGRNKELVQKFLKELEFFDTNYLIHSYFSPVDTPQENDLVVYYEKHNENEFTHSGVIRITEGKLQVESNWSYISDQDVFLHDFFAIPQSFGDLAKVYRFNNGEIYDPPYPPKPLEQSYIQTNDQFISNPANREARQAIDAAIYQAIDAAIPSLIDAEITKKFPQVQVLDINCRGRCYTYALFKTLPEYKQEESHQDDLIGKGNSEILQRYYTETKDPQKGDLAVYSNDSGERTHMGIYLEPDLIESKWGLRRVYRHPFFYVPAEYGDTIRFYQLNPNAKFQLCTIL